MNNRPPDDRKDERQDISKLVPRPNIAQYFKKPSADDSADGSFIIEKVADDSKSRVEDITTRPTSLNRGDFRKVSEAVPRPVIHIPRAEQDPSSTPTFTPHATVTGAHIGAEMEIAKKKIIEELAREKRSLYLEVKNLSLETLTTELQAILSKGPELVWGHIQLKMLLGKMWERVCALQTTTDQRNNTPQEIRSTLASLLKTFPEQILGGMLPVQRNAIEALQVAYRNETAYSITNATPTAAVDETPPQTPQFLEIGDFLQSKTFTPPKELDTSDIELNEIDRKQVEFFENFTDADLNRYFNQAKIVSTNLLGVYQYFTDFSFPVGQVLLRREGLERKRRKYAERVYDKLKELQAEQIGNIPLPDHFAPKNQSISPTFKPLPPAPAIPRTNIPTTNFQKPSVASPTVNLPTTSTYAGLSNRSASKKIERNIAMTLANSGIETTQEPLAQSPTIEATLRNTQQAELKMSGVSQEIHSMLPVNMPMKAFLKAKDGSWIPYWKDAMPLRQQLAPGLALGGPTVEHPESGIPAILVKEAPIARIIQNPTPDTASASAVLTYISDTKDSRRELLIVPQIALPKKNDLIEIVVRDGDRKNQHVISRFSGDELAIGAPFYSDLPNCNGYVTEISMTKEHSLKVTLIRVDHQKQKEEYLHLEIRPVREEMTIPAYFKERMSGAMRTRTVNTSQQSFEQYDKYDIDYIKQRHLTQFMTQTRSITEFHGELGATMSLQCSPSFVMEDKTGRVVERIMAISLCDPAKNQELYASLEVQGGDSDQEKQRKNHIREDLKRIGLYLFENDGTGWYALEKETDVGIPTNRVVTEILQSIPNILRAEQETLEDIQQLFETKTASSIRPRESIQFTKAKARYELINKDMSSFQERINNITEVFDALSAMEWEMGKSAPLAVTSIPSDAVLDAVFDDEAIWRGIPNSHREAFMNKIIHLRESDDIPQDDWLVDLGQRWNLYLKQVLKNLASELFSKQGTVVEERFARYPLRLPLSTTPLKTSIAIEKTELGKLTEVVTNTHFKRRNGVIKMENSTAIHAYVKISSEQGDDILIHVQKQKDKAPEFVEWSAHSQGNLVNANQPLVQGEGFAPLSNLPEFYQNIIGTRSLGFENMAPTFDQFMRGTFKGAGFEGDKYMLIPIVADIGALLNAVEAGKITV